MTVKEAILTLNANIVFAYERAKFDSATVKMVEDALDTIEDALKAQEPRVEMQGRWERVGSDGIVCCSVCGVPMGKTSVCFPDGESGYYYIATKYCPHCGARNEKGDCDG